MTANHLARLRQEMAQRGLDAFVVTQGPHLIYLTGFSGSAGVGVITPTASYVATDFRYYTQVESQAPQSILVKQSAAEQLSGRVAALLNELGAKRVGFEEEFLTAGQLRRLQEALPVEWLPTGGLVEAISLVRDEDEISRMRQAARITSLAVSEVLGLVQPGMTEIEVAGEIEYRFRKHGGTGVAFDTIVATGPNSALPHHRSGNRPWQRDEFLLIDCGSMYNFYCSDSTRTVVMGQPTPEMEKIWYLVREAQVAALEAVRPGIRACDLDEVARGVIRDAGYGEYFGHGLGHGVGPKIHTDPRLNSQSAVVLEAGMVITIEPGIYLPGKGGVRLEELIVVREDGAEILTHIPVELVLR